ncbi:MAG: hypothetical protein AB1651_15070 [Pseudomonadota bacterium]
MSKVMVMGSVHGFRRSGGTRPMSATLRRLPATLAYSALGCAGFALWMLMQLPVGARAKNTLVYAMAGCIGLFTLGRQLLRADTAQARRRR